MVILLLVSVLMGFAVGRRLGIRQGFREGIAYAALDLRRQSLEQNRCPICSPGQGDEASGTGMSQDDSDRLDGDVGPETPSTGVMDRKIDALCLQDVTSEY